MSLIQPAKFKTWETRLCKMLKHFLSHLLNFKSWIKLIYDKITYSQGQKSSYDCLFPYEMAFFQEGVVEGNNAVTPWVSFDSNQA